MTEKPPTIDSFAIVSEEMIIFCANQVADDEDNNFQRVLENAQVFRRAGMNPIFLTTPNFKELMVTSVERMKNKFH